MKRLSLIISLFSIVICCSTIAAAESQHSICNLNFGEDKLSKILTNKPSPNESKNLISSIAKSSVIIAGETHLYTDLNTRIELMNMVKKIKGNKNTCVALELPNHPIGSVAFLSDLKETAVKTRSDGNIYQANTQDDLINYYESMMNYAISIGLKVKPVDHPKSWIDYLSNDIRDQAMVSNIIEALQTQDCETVLFFVGKAHETKSTGYSPALSQLFKAKEVTTTSVNLQMTYEDLMPIQIRTWFICPDTANQIQKSIVIESNQIPEDLQIAPYSGEKMRFADFDYTWIIPFQDRDIPCSACAKSYKSKVSY